MGFSSKVVTSIINFLLLFTYHSMTIRVLFVTGPGRRVLSEFQKGEGESVGVSTILNHSLDLSLVVHFRHKRYSPLCTTCQRTSVSSSSLQRPLFHLRPLYFVQRSLIHVYYLKGWDMDILEVLKDPVHTDPLIS